MGAKTGSWRDEPGESTTGVEFTEHYISLTITARLELSCGAKVSQTGGFLISGGDSWITLGPGDIRDIWR